jgi:hypothetical protein
MLWGHPALQRRPGLEITAIHFRPPPAAVERVMTHANLNPTELRRSALPARPMEAYSGNTLHWWSALEE